MSRSMDMFVVVVGWVGAWLRLSGSPSHSTIAVDGIAGVILEPPKSSRSPDEVGDSPST